MKRLMSRVILIVEIELLIEIELLEANEVSLIIIR